MNQPVGKRYFERLMPARAELALRRIDGRVVNRRPSCRLRPHAIFGQVRPCPSSIVTILSILGQGQPNEEPACPRPLRSICRIPPCGGTDFPTSCSPSCAASGRSSTTSSPTASAKTVKRDFWMATKHRHAQRIHRDTDSFTATDGPLIQGVGIVGSAPTIINMDPPDLIKRRTGDVARVHPEGDRQARGGHPQARRGDDRPAAREGRRRLDRRRRRRAADVGHRRHHRHPRGGPAGDLRHASTAS